MREVDRILIKDKRGLEINIGNFYDNLKMSVNYTGQDNEMGIYANAQTYFRNSVLEILEQLNESVCVYLEGQQSFREMKDFLKWIYSKENLELGIEVHKKFIDNAYNIIKEKGIY